MRCRCRSSTTSCDELPNVALQLVAWGRDPARGLVSRCSSATLRFRAAATRCLTGLRHSVKAGTFATGRAPTLVALLVTAFASAWRHLTGSRLPAHIARSAQMDFDSLSRASTRLTAVKLAREAREASARTGRAVLATATDARLRPLPSELTGSRGSSPGNHAVVVGLPAQCSGFRARTQLSGSSTRLPRAGSRPPSAWPCGHRTAQAVLHHSRSVIAAAARALDRDADQISSCTPLLDVMAMRHEQAEIRLFAT